MTELFRFRAAAQEGNQGVMGVHPTILSPATKPERSGSPNTQPGSCTPS
jgi:hypothetical protein